MTLLSVNTKIVNTDQDIILLPSTIIKKLQLRLDQPIPLLFGLKGSLPVRVKKLNKNSNEIKLSSSVRNKLNIPYTTNLYLQKQENSLRLGPVVGILTTDLFGRKFSNISQKNKNFFGKFFKGLLIQGQNYPVFYFAFTPDRINWSTLTVRGVFYHPSKFGDVWKEYTVPLPEVVYNRIPNRQSENSSEIAQLKSEYKRLGGKMFNPDFFNKWDIYQLLSKEETISRYFPETYSNPSLKTMENMLNKYPIVYLKPGGGSLGLGIYKLKKEANGYHVQFRLGNKNKIYNVNNVATIYNSIFNRKNPKNYLIQQGIQLIEYQGRPVDFRIQLHKNKLNQWNLIAIGGKAAGKGSVTTHIRTGGNLIDSTLYLKQLYGGNTNKMISNIKQTSIQIAEALEKKLRKPIGELGLDIGIDQNQHIWLFEVNSKPGRSIFKHPSIKATEKLANQYLLEYAMFLSKNK